MKRKIVSPAKPPSHKRVKGAVARFFKKKEAEKVLSKRAREAAARVLRNPENSKKAKTARGSALSQSPR